MHFVESHSVENTS